MVEAQQKETLGETDLFGAKWLYGLRCRCTHATPVTLGILKLYNIQDIHIDIFTMKGLAQTNHPWVKKQVPQNFKSLGFSRKSWKPTHPQIKDHHFYPLRRAPISQKTSLFLLFRVLPVFLLRILGFFFRCGWWRAWVTAFHDPLCPIFLFVFLFILHQDLVLSALLQNARLI